MDNRSEQRRALTASPPPRARAYGRFRLPRHHLRQPVEDPQKPLPGRRLGADVRYWPKRTWASAPHMSAHDPKRRHWTWVQLDLAPRVLESVFARSVAADHCPETFPWREKASQKKLGCKCAV